MMREVTIYDMADPTRRRTIFADSGNMRMSKGLTDLELTLYNGNMQDVPTASPNELQRLYFNIDQIRVKGVGNQFQKTTQDAYKSDREMTVCEMQEAQDRARREHEQARKDVEKTRAALLKTNAKLSKDVLNADTSAPWDIGLGRLYCNALSFLAPKKAKAQGVTASSTPLNPWATKQHASSTPVLGAGQGPATPVAVLRAPSQGPPPSSSNIAAIVFGLLGAPIALRFPRGGVGLTIGVSLFVFALYYVCLIAGESIAKRGLMPAVVSMWMANVIFSIVALWLLSKMGKEGSTARGGDMRDMINAIKGSIRSKIGWKDRRVRRDRVAA